jgi:hypothetical protein
VDTGSVPGSNGAATEEAVMIARIMGEGQVRLADADLTRLNELDNELLATVESGDEEAFRRTLGALLDTVRSLGEPPELILPTADATLDEVRAMLKDDGLIPG